MLADFGCEFASLKWVMLIISHQFDDKFSFFTFYSQQVLAVGEVLARLVSYMLTKIADSFRDDSARI